MSALATPLRISYLQQLKESEIISFPTIELKSWVSLTLDQLRSYVYCQEIYVAKGYCYEVNHFSSISSFHCYNRIAQKEWGFL
jgi:hypothetical protein